MTHPDEDTLRALLDDIRTATRQAHGLLADVRRERTELERWKTDLEHSWKRDTLKRIEVTVTEGLDQFKNVTERSMDEVEKRIYKRFDTIVNILMGTGRAEPIDGVDLEKAAKRLRAAAEHIVYDTQVIPPALRGRR